MTDNFREAFKGTLKGNPAAEKAMTGFLESFAENKQLPAPKPVEEVQISLDTKSILLGDALSRFPSGFLISKTALLYEIIYIAPDILTLQEHYIEPPEMGGFIAVTPVEGTTFNEVDATFTIEQIAKLIPEEYLYGIAISNSGMVYNVLSSTTELTKLLAAYPTPPLNGGFLVASIPTLKPADRRYIVKESSNDSSE